MNKLLKKGSVAALGAVMLVATAGSAQAASWGPETIYKRHWDRSGGVIGSAKWTDSGDKLTVCDKRADGKAVMVYVVKSGGTTPVLKVTASGKGKCKSGSKNLDESKKYEWWVSHGLDGDDRVWVGKP
ncbi:hypothetical protein [Streptomyces spiramyceticus]|uniref:hypothetical protein n=1 Tax=Streptomyces spiramyceticus TaxID=299717 RepID=UPI00237A6BCA|nr:hypothetical protein [Streptomyces spiramyceticus]